MMRDGWSSQQRREERMANRKSVNEVDALRDVFYSFFDMKQQQKINDNDRVLVSQQQAEFDYNPFFKYDGEEEADMKFANRVNYTSPMYAYATNLTGMFDHLNQLNDRRELDMEFNQEYEERNSISRARNDSDFFLNVITEQANDETGLVDYDKNSEDVNDEDVVSHDKFEPQKPSFTQERRATMMSETTVLTTNNFSSGQISSDSDDEVEAPWVDRIKLRHGMDWLDLITNEVDRDTQRVNIRLSNIRLSHKSRFSINPSIKSKSQVESMKRIN